MAQLFQIVVAVVLAFSAFMLINMSKKTGKASAGKAIVSLILAAAVLVGSLNLFGVQVINVGDNTISIPALLPGTARQAAAAAEDDPDRDQRGCEPTGVDVSATIFVTHENTGQSITEAGVYREIGTNLWRAFTPGTALTVLSPGTTYEFMPGITRGDSFDAVHTPIAEWTIPCGDTDPTREIKGIDDETFSSITNIVYNGGHTASTAETIVENVEGEYFFQVKSGSRDEDYGNRWGPDGVLGNTLGIGVNTTAFSTRNWAVYVEKAPSCSGLQEGDRLPDGDSVVNETTAAEITHLNWKFPVIGCDGGTYEFRIHYGAPTATGVAGPVDLTGYIYDGTHFINTDTGEREFGVENDNNADIASIDAETFNIDIT